MFDAKKLRAVREEKNMSREDLANVFSVEKSPLTQQTIYNWERGATVPDANEVAIIALHFNKPVGFFFNSKSTNRLGLVCRK